MGGKWSYEIQSRNHLNTKTPDLDTVQSDNLTAIERFVREIISNCRDARFDTDENSPVKVGFHLLDIEGKNKRCFLNSICFNELERAYNNILSDQGQNHLEETFLNINPVNINNSEKLRLLCIEDHNTKGLIGPEFITVSDSGEDNRFIALCRSIGLNATGENADSSGTWGYGKSVIWANNHTRIALFHSVLSKPFEINDTTVKRRLIGYTKLPDFLQCEDEGVSGDIYFGEKINDREVQSYWNNKAVDVAKVINIRGFNRKDDDYGSSILIVGFEPSDDSNDDTLTIAKNIKNAIEKYFWPAISDNTVEITLSCNNADIPIEPLNNPSVKPYVRLYKKAMNFNSADERNLLLKVKGPTLKPFNAHLLLSYNIFPEADQNCTLLNKIAKIRGTRMVIDYTDPHIGNVSGHYAVGLALCGELISKHPDVDRKEQAELGDLLRLSEPISHHKWDDRNKKLKTVMGGSRIKEINNKIVQKFKALVMDRDAEVIQGQSTLLSSLFPFGGALGSSSSHGGEIHYDTISPMRKVYSETDDTNTYSHLIEFLIPRKNDLSAIRGPHRPKEIRFTAKFSPVDESGKPINLNENILTFKITKLEVTIFDQFNNPDIVTTRNLRQGTLQFIESVEPKMKKCRVSFKSNPVPKDLSDVMRICPQYKWEKRV